MLITCLSGINKGQQSRGGTDTESSVVRHSSTDKMSGTFLLNWSNVCHSTLQMINWGCS